MTNTNIELNENEITLIKLREYNTMVDLGDEVYAIEGLVEFSDSAYICDAISEQADGYTPIYYNGIWENVKDIREYIEDAISQGLASMDGNTSLETIFQAGYYNYYQAVMYENLDVMVFNTIAKKVNEYISYNDLANVDTLAIEDHIDSLSIDSDSLVGEIIENADAIKGDINEGDYNKQ